MTKSTTLVDDEVPKWDIALEGLANDTYRMKGAALNIDDFQKLAVDNRIRFDDIMVTMFELCIYSKWQYKNDQGEVTITRQTLDQLFVNGRLQEKDMRDFSGDWMPLA
ncbi:hypothetical protein MNBD_GAMMA17-971 [hydrothermal vent metagenome]|uniref:Uncharacterized protein n=1 Tax=hydrothermal vent metagenome TaxID=652676 RepID=A0A3B0ZWY6_9ZZZZ